MYDINSLLLSIIVLLKEPNPDSPANPRAAKLYLEDQAKFYEETRQFTYESWGRSFET
jgi:ubiquitin-protein ligase